MSADNADNTTSNNFTELRSRTGEWHIQFDAQSQLTSKKVDRLRIHPGGFLTIHQAQTDAVQCVIAGGAWQVVSDDVSFTQSDSGTDTSTGKNKR